MPVRETKFELEKGRTLEFEFEKWDGPLKLNYCTGMIQTRRGVKRGLKKRSNRFKHGNDQKV